jgi:hypothetical protein
MATRAAGGSVQHPAAAGNLGQGKLALDASNACAAALAQLSGQGVTLSASYPTTAGQMVTWDHSIPAHLGSSPFSTWPSSEPVSVCYFSGDFTFPKPATATPPVLHAEVVVLSSAGVPNFDFATPGSISSFAQSPPPPPAS